MESKDKLLVGCSAVIKDEMDKAIDELHFRDGQLTYEGL